MVYFLIFSILLLLIAVVSYITFIRIYYTSKSLNELREVRHDVTLYLIDNLKNSGMPTDKLTEYQRLVNISNDIIVNYDRLKNHITRFKWVKSLFHVIIISNRKIKSFHPDEQDEKLKDFRARYCRSISTAFNAIPLFRIRLIAHLMQKIFYILMKLGVHSMKVRLKKLNQLHAIERNYHDNCLV